VAKLASCLSTAITRLTNYTVGLAAFGILVIVLLQVASRLLSIPVAWTEEATRYLFIWMIFLGIAAGFRTVEMARVTVFLGLLPTRLRRLSVPIYVVSSVLFFILIVWTGLGLVQQQYRMNETAATLVIPMWLIGTIMPISAVLAVFAIIDSLRTRYTLIASPEAGITVPVPDETDDAQADNAKNAAATHKDRP